MSTTTIIQRRDLEPLWSKASEVARHYERAGNCVSAVIGADYVSMEPSKTPKCGIFCVLCRRHNIVAPDMTCGDLHAGAVKEAIRLGGSYIYTCRSGFCFWTSPFFSMERFAGAFVSGGVLACERQKAAERVFKACNGDVPMEEIVSYLEELPERSMEEIEALARMMTLCTEYISRLESNHGDMLPADLRREVMERINNTSLPSVPDIADRERLMLAHLRRGDSNEAQNIARKLFNDLSDTVKHEPQDEKLEGLRLKALEMAVLFSRYGATDEKNEALAEVSINNLKRIRAAKNESELIDNVCLSVERMAGRIFSFQGLRHASALRKAERYIWDNYTRKVSLKEIADASGLSAPYFSTIFKEEMGENLSDYLNRLRVERASVMLLETDLLVSEISSACGFEDQSWFSKIFRNHTGISPCKYRRTVGAGPVEIVCRQNAKGRGIQSG